MSGVCVSQDAVTHNNDTRILTAHDFNTLMDACGVWPSDLRIAVAVSGGPDSIALTFLLHAWIKQRGGELFALTIDHQLRAESASEAAQVKQWCKDKSIHHQTLAWEKEQAPISALHERARNARYELLLQACRQHNINTLFLGHHADDQAETVLMRFLKGSGVDGLAGMPCTYIKEGVKLIRPLLPVQKRMLENTCNANNWAFIRDSSNHSQHYLRGRLRSLAQPLEAEGVTTATLYDIARSSGMARAALEQSTNEWLAEHAMVSPLGIIQLDINIWKKLNDEMKRRTITRILLCMSSENYPPKQTSLEHLISTLLTTENPHLTLSGCHVIVQFGLLKFYREQSALLFSLPEQPTRIQNTMFWDNRFKISIDSSLMNKNMCIAPLGEFGKDKLEKMGHKQVADCPALARATLPALYAEHQLHHVPEFFSNEQAAQASQAPVKAIFLPKRMLIIERFDVCSLLLA
jgi:tRNA(Ile)-lysidine synthase